MMPGTERETGTLRRLALRGVADPVGAGRTSRGWP